MAIFRIEFEREYTITEGCTRYVEADTVTDAMAKAVRLCGIYNYECPDDVSEIGGGCAMDFFAITVPADSLPAGEALTDPDEEG